MIIASGTRPPNFERIAAVFPGARNAGTIFCYGDTIYNPGKVRITPYLLAHEQVHSNRQEAMGIDKWWERYLRDAEFRFFEELLAHRSEWLAVQMKCPMKHLRAGLLDAIVKRLASELYGGMCGLGRARHLITSPLVEVTTLPEGGDSGILPAAG